MKLIEKLGITDQECNKLYDAFIRFYSIPQEHKGIVIAEFEAFVVGYKLACLREKQGEKK